MTLKIVNEIDIDVEILTTMIQQAAWDSIPEVKPNNKKQNYTSIIKEVGRENKKLRKNWMTL